MTKTPTISYDQLRSSPSETSIAFLHFSQCGSLISCQPQNARHFDRLFSPIAALTIHNLLPFLCRTPINERRRFYRRSDNESAEVTLPPSRPFSWGGGDVRSKVQYVPDNPLHPLFPHLPLMADRRTIILVPLLHGGEKINKIMIQTPTNSNNEKP